MEKMIDLRDLLQHEIMDLYSAEEQIIEALPQMIEKAKDPSLKKALRDHLKVTEEQKNRLDEVRKLLDGEGARDEDAEENKEESNKKKGFFSKLFGGSEGKQFCKGTEGLIKEGKKMMGEDMSAEVMDAAIIASAQKIEHYEISGYGTARAYAGQLNLKNVASLLEQTLNEEYQADDLLTKLAVGGINEEAETSQTGSNGQKQPVGKSSSNGKGSASDGKASAKGSHAKSKSVAKKSPSGTNSRANGVKKSSPAGKKSAPKASNSSRDTKKVNKKSAAKSSAGKKGK